MRIQDDKVLIYAIYLTLL